MSGARRAARAHVGQASRLGAEVPAGPAPALPPGCGLQNPMSIYIHHVPQHSPAEMAEVHAAVETLYRDELRPYGRILRKRLTERAQATGRGAVDIDVRLLRDLCAASPWLSVQDEEGGDWSSILRCRPASFVDVYSPQDVYPKELWKAAEAYFGSLNEIEMVLPGGRYLCAQVLAARQLPFLAGRSLGQICHIVQLAISQKKMLGYLNGSIVPYSRSQSMVKERCAEYQRPCSNAARKAGAIANWDTLHACVHELVRSMSPGVSSIPLSNVKRLFRSRFHIELSETALGYAKLSELFQDDRLQDVCAVRLQGQGYVIVPAVKADCSKPISLAESLPSRDVTCGATAEAASNSSLRNRARWIQPLDSEDLTAPEPPRAAAPAGTGESSPSATAKDEGVGVGFLNMFPSTPSPSSMRAHSLPTLLGSLKCRRDAKKHDAGLLLEHEEDHEGACGVVKSTLDVAEGRAAAIPPSEAAMGRSSYAAPPYAEGVTVAAQSELQMQAFPEATLPGQTTAASVPVMLTPSTLGHLGFMVQNTFIHAAVPPSTPPHQGLTRSHSLPRNLGSDSSEHSGGHR